MSEIVIVMGYNASGKSTLVEEFVSDGYLRLNRDEMGGSLDKQAVHAEKAIQGGHDKVVLDNTYPTIASRESIVAVGRDKGIPVRCVWLTTSPKKFTKSALDRDLVEASMNACLRMCDKTGKVLCTPADLKADEYKKDPNLFPIAALFHYKKVFEPPTTDEGFSQIDAREFVRHWPATHTNKALILDYDDTLRTSTGPKKWPEHPSHVKVLPGRKKVVQQAKKDGYLILGASNQSACAKGLSIDVAKACFDKTNRELGVDIEYAFCPHGVPPTCYCRKPQVGMGAFFIWKYKLLPFECIMVGDSTSDRTFAKRCGFQFQTEVEFFGE